MTLIIYTEVDELEIVKKQSSSTVLPGDEHSYSITVTNSGDLLASGLAVTDILSRDLSYSSDSSGVAPLVNGSTYLWKLKNKLEPGQSFSFTVKTRVADELMSGTRIRNRACVTSTEIQEPVCSNTVTASTGYVRVESGDLKISKRVNLHKVRIGGILRYTIRISNNSPGAIFDLKLVDRLPRGFQYIKGRTSLNGKKYADPAGKRSLRWDLNFLAPGASMRLHYQVVIGANVATGRNINTAEASGVDGGSNQVSAEASAIVFLGSGHIKEPGSILVTVYLDRDKDKILDAADRPMSGIRIIMPPSAKRTSNKDGEVKFDLLVPGRKAVAVDERSLPDNIYFPVRKYLLNLIQTFFVGKAVKF